MISILKADITRLQVDIIVNAANNQLAGGGGVDGAIHRAAGPTLADACRKIGYCATGDAVITHAGNLPAKFVIHTVGPVWKQGTANEPELLKRCYQRSFQLAVDHKAHSIALPAISTGVYGYPIELATEIALGVGKTFESKIPDIRFVCFSDSHLQIYQHLFQNLYSS